MSATCRSRAAYGRCGRTAGHGVPHAVPIGDGVWFGYMRGGQPLGYGRFDGNVFRPSAQRSAEGAHINEGDQVDG